MKSSKYVLVATTMWAVASILQVGQAFAHAHLQKAEPAQNAVVHVAPAQVTVKFSEELETTMSKLEVKEVASGLVVSTGKVSGGGQGDSTLQISLKPLKKDKAKYQVTWKAVTKDTHKMQGTYNFTYDPKE
jgi:methionine-rich copper-binding protein CopC